MKKTALLILSILAITLSQSLISEDLADGSVNYETEIFELNKSIEMLKKWQLQYMKKHRSYEAHNKRVLFRSESTSDGKRAQSLAEEAKANALELQEQIDVLASRKESLEASK